MELNKIRQLITNNIRIEKEILNNKRYYEVENDITRKGVKPKNESKDPLRSADNRIAHNYHQILVDEKAAYLFTYPILFDIDNNVEVNEAVTMVLGEDFPRKCKNLCIEASNTGLGWLHYWIEEPKFKYELVNTEEVIPRYSNGLEKELEAIIRYYKTYEEVEGLLEDQLFCYIEYWTKEEMQRWKFKDSYMGSIVETEKIIHNLKEVPFIEFNNNKSKKSDLKKYKYQIDLIDKVMSGYANDMEDIQQIIYILEGYGGTDLNEFLSDLKRYKTVKNDGGGDLKTLQIDIPTEARKIILDTLRRQIYESGQGLQQDMESVSNSSGVALKFFYRKLELKAGLLETEFRSGFATLVKAILRFLKVENYKKINQTWTRNMISNDLENSQIAQASMGIIPKKIILANHPWVDDVQLALDLLEEEEKGNIIDYNFNAIGETNE